MKGKRLWFHKLYRDGRLCLAPGRQLPSAGRICTYRPERSKAFHNSRLCHSLSLSLNFDSISTLPKKVGFILPISTRSSNVVGQNAQLSHYYLDSDNEGDHPAILPADRGDDRDFGIGAGHVWDLRDLQGKTVSGQNTTFHTQCEITFVAGCGSPSKW